ncbi:hypothetical protein [Arthrobacter sp. B0490]|uniref:hypothetical protein n=1 Tax=Arthrobacter sp. B0490 TaxID=2058891 RepID=UPI000CE39FC2|nr:hypothetical protein [Arthrobacter sp. B0490]
MTRDIPADEQRRLTAHAIKAAGLTLQSVWERYFGITGNADMTEIEAHLYGAFPLSDEEADILTHAVNELINEMPALPRAPYSTHLTTADVVREIGSTGIDS